MSKYLIKILSICAFVVLIPLVIVGSALCVTEAMACTLSVLQGGIEGGYGASSEVSIYIDNELQDGNEISVKKNTEVTVTYQGVGYDFVGWFNGNYSEINREQDEVLTASTSYTFVVEQNTTLTAVRDIKQYTITYDGLMDDGSEVVIDETEQGKIYKYGETLKTLSPITDLTFDGWSVINSTDVNVYKTATFAQSGEITLKAVWVDKTYTIKVSKSYYSQDEISNITYKPNQGFSKYNVERTGYTFVGLNYNDKLYTYDAERNDYINNGESLATLIINNNLDEIQVTAEWDCVYPDFSLYITGVSEYEYEGSSAPWEVFGKIGNEYVIISEIQKSIMFEDKEGDNYYSLESSDIVNLAFGEYEEGIYRLTDEGYQEVKLGDDNSSFTSIEIRVNNIANSIEFVLASGETMTFADIFNTIQLKISDGSLNLNIEDIYKISLTFNFVLA